MIVYLVRHGESLSRRHLNHDEGSRIGLSSYGKSQVLAVTRRLKKKDITRIISSPLARARETAVILAESLGLTCEYDERLHEWVPAPTLKGEALQNMKIKARHERDLVLDGGESFNQSARRFLDVLTELASRGDRAVCVVSHELIIQNALLTLFRLREVLPIGLASISALEYKNGIWEILALNKKPLFFGRVYRKIMNIFRV